MTSATLRIAAPLALALLAGAAGCRGEDFHVNIRVHNYRDEPIQIWRESGPVCDYLGNVAPGVRRYFAMDYAFEGDTLLAYDARTRELLDVEFAYDELKWAVD